MAQKSVCVTGANGFIASWIVCKLLQRGYTVHGTVRDPDNEKKCGHLKNLEGAEERLKLFQADVLDHDSLVPAIRGCQGVFHTACPVATKFEKPEEVVDPAVIGTRNVMTLCSKENVKRVVMTSSGAAVTADPKRPADKIVDESCWSDLQTCREKQMWYFVAKTESEMLAWNLCKELNLDLVVICPVMVSGPILQAAHNFSVDYFKRLVEGSSYPNSWIRIVDVRDVAEAHILALENPAASGRYYCFTDALLHKTILDILKAKFPQYSYPEKCEGEETGGIPPSMASNKKIKDLLGNFIPCEQSLVETIASLQEKGLVPGNFSYQ